MARAKLEYRLLGPVEASVGGRRVHLGGARQRAVLALLLLNHNRAVSVERMADELWGGAPPPSAVGILRTTVSSLRKSFVAAGGIDAPLRTLPGGYQIDARPDQIDALTFESLLRSAARARADDPDRALDLLDRALGLWRGEALADLRDELFVRADVARLDAARLAALAQRGEVLLALGRHEQVIGDLQALVIRHPLHEHFRAQLMLALYRSGRQAESLRVFGSIRRHLIEELGLEPGPQLRDLESAILRQDPALDWPAASAGAAAPGPQPPMRRDPASVGGESPLDVLMDRMTRAIGGHGGLVLVWGGPGVGTTGPVRDLVDQAAALGAEVSWGRSYEDDRAPAYWPWSRALRPGVTALASRHRSEPDLAATVTGPLAHVAAIIPEIRWMLPEPAPLVVGDPATRARLFESVEVLLYVLGRQRPRLIVLEDIHWADPGSLLLLRFLAPRLVAMPVLVVATTRRSGDEEAPMAELLVDLDGQPTEDVTVVRAMPLLSADGL